MQTDSFSYALERLDPASRALLDLSLRRGMRTEEIADVLGAEPESVEASRDEALQRIASDVGMNELDEVRARLAELPADEWLGTRHRNGNSTAEAAPPEAEAEKPKRRGRIWPLLLGLVVTAAVSVAIALATGGSDDESSSSTPTQTAAPTPPAQTGVPTATELRPLGATHGTGTASLAQDGKRVLVAARGLRPGHYQVWLYNSILDARPIAAGNGPRFTVRPALPGNWKRFRFVDVSRERRDGNLSHSGESVLRVSTNALGAKP